VFRYETDVRGRCLPTEPVPECLLREQTGYCQHYATTMTMMLRTLNVPARYVQGFLPGKRLPDGTREVDASAAHAWVEVYFPSYGWVAFDPTPAGNTENGQHATELPVGDPVPVPSFQPGAPRPTPVFGDGASPAPETPPPPPQRAEGPDTGSGSRLDALLGPLAAGGALVLAMLLLVGLLRLLRVPGRDPVLLYRGLTSMAGRLGHPPRPEQTAYEYTATLGEQVPSVRVELAMVARAKVEATYGRRRPRAESIGLLTRAYRRARIGLLRLLLRRRAGGLP
jgi:hypothetical protein